MMSTSSGRNLRNASDQVKSTLMIATIRFYYDHLALQQLRYFNAPAGHRHFGRAAEASAVSRTLLGGWPRKVADVSDKMMQRSKGHFTSSGSVHLDLPEASPAPRHKSSGRKPVWCAIRASIF
jgi:hypothetical protein